MAPLPHPSRRHRAFTLVEILVVLAIVGILLTMAMVLTRGVSAAQKRSLTATRLAGVDIAMVQFVMRMRRLPCPADGTIASGMPNAGLERRDAAGACTLANQTAGVVPWVTLGLPEADGADGWDRRITYRTSANLATDSAMDMSSCDPAGTGPATGGGLCFSPCTNATLATCTPPTPFLANKGLQVQTIVGAIQMNPATSTGAAYVAVSPGESGGGGYLNSGQLSASSTADGLEEAKNYGNLALQPYYVDDSLSDVAGPNHFDDMVSRPSVLAVITKAALGPRSH